MLTLLFVQQISGTNKPTKAASASGGKLSGGQSADEHAGYYNALCWVVLDVGQVTFRHPSCSAKAGSRGQLRDRAAPGVAVAVRSPMGERLRCGRTLGRDSGHPAAQPHRHAEVQTLWRAVVLVPVQTLWRAVVLVPALQHVLGVELR